MSFAPFACAKSATLARLPSGWMTRLAVQVPTSSPHPLHELGFFLGVVAVPSGVRPERVEGEAVLRVPFDEPHHHLVGPHAAEEGVGHHGRDQLALGVAGRLHVQHEAVLDRAHLARRRSLRAAEHDDRRRAQRLAGQHAEVGLAEARSCAEKRTKLQAFATPRSAPADGDVETVALGEVEAEVRHVALLARRDPEPGILFREEQLVRRGMVERGPLPRAVRRATERAVAHPVALDIAGLRREHLYVARVADKRPHADRVGVVPALCPVVAREVEACEVAHGKGLLLAERIQLRHVLRRVEVAVELPRHAHAELFVRRRVLVDLRRPAPAAR